MAGEKPASTAVDGILLLDKPLGLSSNAALQRAKRLLGARRAGHTGTLDPLATGLLPLCMGEATKFGGHLLDATKGYEATVRLGATTTTGDAEGEVLELLPVNCDRGQVDAALERFRGVITQLPPMYSAIKMGGRPLYDYARKGIEVERKPRQVEIYALELGFFEGESLGLRVRCSKGTYIRTLAEDLGRALGCGAHLTALRRTLVGPFSIDKAITLADLEALAPGERAARLLAPDLAIRHLPPLALDEAQRERLFHGREVPIQGDFQPGTARVYGPDQAFLGMGEVSPEGHLKALRLVALEQAQRLEN